MQKKCIHLGNTFSSTSKKYAVVTNSIIDLNSKTNNLLLGFFFSESTTLPRLFSLFCRLCRYSVYNSDTTRGEKSDILCTSIIYLYDDWYGNLSNIYVKIGKNH